MKSFLFYTILLYVSSGQQACIVVGDLYSCIYPYDVLIPYFPDIKINQPPDADGTRLAATTPSAATKAPPPA